MAIKQFSNLTEQEIALLVKAPALITVLIAGADDNISKKEKDWAAKLVHYRTFTAEPQLQNYYEAVKEGFNVELDTLVESWNSESEEAIATQLSGVNAILPKIDPEYASMLKESWRSLAHKVAGASGGLLGFGSMDEAEKKLVSLPMIQ
ncbi:MAG: hypothetical protein SF052_17140 [Bacteroidia bacterium]|nr:hypothetical protein [Bacteroidia bacterium]